MILGLDHVQVAAPPGCEAAARRFYGELLGLREIAKPPELQSRGGVWFACGAQQLHVGVEEPFSPARRRTLRSFVDAGRIEELAAGLAADDVAVAWDDAIHGLRRFYVADPWGNRVEITTGALAQRYRGGAQPPNGRGGRPRG